MRPAAISENRGPHSSAAIPALTGLRFIAAALVAFAHYNNAANVTIAGMPLEVSGLGMSIFFCLSGFIIHYVYAQSFRDNWKSASGEFALARFSRLYPLFLFFVLFSLLFYPKLREAFDDPVIAASYLTLTGTWWYWLHDGKVLHDLPFGISWSISTEWFFYCVYALGLYRLSAITSARVCIAALFGTYVAGVAALAFIYGNWADIEPIAVAHFPSAIPISREFVNSFFRWLFYVSPYVRIFEFIAGCLTCQLYFLLRGNCRSREVVFWIGIAVLATTLILYGMSYLPENAAFMRSSWVWIFMQYMHMNLLFAPGILLVMLGAALGSRAAHAALGGSAIVFLGEISYSIYLGHPWVGGFAYVSANFDYKWLGLAADLVVASIVATGLYSLIEMPAKRWLRKTFSRGRLVVIKPRPEPAA